MEVLAEDSSFTLLKCWIDVDIRSMSLEPTNCSNASARPHSSKVKTIGCKCSGRFPIESNIGVSSSVPLAEVVSPTDSLPDLFPMPSCDLLG